MNIYTYSTIVGLILLASWHHSMLTMQDNTSSHSKNISEESSLPLVLPSYNNDTWYKLNLSKITKQKYGNYKVVYIDDKPAKSTMSLFFEAYRSAKKSGDQERMARIRVLLHKQNYIENKGDSELCKLMDIEIENILKTIE